MRRIEKIVSFATNRGEAKCAIHYSSSFRRSSGGAIAGVRHSSAGKSEGRAVISAETEYGFLLVAIFCLTGLLITLGAMIYFPDLGAVIAEYNQI